MDSFDLREWSGLKSVGEPLVIDQIAIDSRRIYSPRSLFVALEGKNSDGHEFLGNAYQRGAKWAIVRRDFPNLPEIAGLNLIKVEDPLVALQEIAKLYRQKLKCKILAVAGSYGKTMVKDLTWALLATSKKAAASPESFNSQIGVALSLFTLTSQDEVAVLEAGISQQGEMERLIDMIGPNFGLITHLGKKHLTTLGNLETAASELLKIFQTNSLEWALLPNEPKLTAQMKVSLPYHYWNLSDGELPFAEALPAVSGLGVPYKITFPDGSLFQSTMTAGFSYFLDLVNMSIKAAWKLGVSKEAICTILADYTVEPMRTEIWKSEKQVLFINDTYCSDPQSIDQSLNLLKTVSGEGRRLFLFGGLRGCQDSNEYARIAGSINAHRIDTLCLYGSHNFETLIAEVTKSNPCTTIFKVETYFEALDILKRHLRPHDTLLIKGEHKEPFEKLLQKYHESLLTNLCLINLAAIESNIQALRSKLPKGTRMMAMVKALAYGTDDVRIATFLKSCGVDILGVSYVDEALSLKRGHVTQDIFVLNAAVYEAAKVVKWGLEVGVSDLAFIEVLGQIAAEEKKTVKVHLHVDTGMCRFGCRPEMALELARAIKAMPYLKLEGIMTHFASSDNPEDDAFTYLQAGKLDQVIGELKLHGIEAPWHHAANSGGAIRFNFPQYNMVRIGLAAYGLYPSEAVQKSLDLRLAVSLISRIVGINICKKGESISYGRTYVNEREEQKIAVLPIGYFDGIHRSYSNKAHVLIRGRKAPMVGKICMDFLMVDVTDIEDVSIGDSALIFGEDEYGHYLSPEDFANSGNSIIHELMTCLGPRIQRIFVIEESKKKR